MYKLFNDRNYWEPYGDSGRWLQRERGLEDENDDVEDENFFHDDGLVGHVAQGGLEDQLVCVVELKDEIFERVCIIDWDSPPIYCVYFDDGDLEEYFYIYIYIYIDRYIDIQEIDAHQMFSANPKSVFLGHVRFAYTGWFGEPTSVRWIPKRTFRVLVKMDTFTWKDVILNDSSIGIMLNLEESLYFWR